MYDLQPFRRTLYFVLLLGMAGFGLASESPGILLLGVCGVALHFWLVKSGRFHPLPRLVANAITLIALLYAFNEMRSSGNTPILTIGQFLVLLQIVKLFELRANRDYAQLLVLSLLLMVAATISTASLVFALMLLVYLFLSLHCCLLFHLKVEHDEALAAQTLPLEKLTEATVKQDQRHLARSMRKLAGMVSVAAALMAVSVFLFFPRGSGGGMLNALQTRAQAMTGFSSSGTSLGEVSRIQQDSRIVANVSIKRGGRMIEGTMPLYLRGITHDRYSTLTRKWTREDSVRRGMREYPTAAGVETEFANVPADRESMLFHQHISLQPIGDLALFSMPMPVRFTPDRDLGRINFNREDSTFSAAFSPPNQRLDYDVVSRSFDLDGPSSEGGRPFAEYETANNPPFVEERLTDRGSSLRIAQFAAGAEIGGTDARGRPLADLRPRTAIVTALDEQIARNIEKHLRSKYGYTLDLTGEAYSALNDPVERFLFDWKKGHCEYFASAMVLMCQSLGLQARYVTGFRSDEYDASMGHYYIVRRSHAHAWVEVRTPRGWLTFDPTGGNEVGGETKAGTWQAVKHFFNFLEYKWASSVVAYDGDNRKNLIDSIDRKVYDSMVNTKVGPKLLGGSFGRWWAQFKEWLNEQRNAGAGWLLVAQIAMAMIGLLACVLLYHMIKTVAQRKRMKRRAQRIGLGDLPASEQIELARQLGFYEHLTTILQRRQIVRPAHLTPAEFSDSLDYLPNEAFDAIRGLTRHFYAIRFGKEQLSDDDRRQLEQTVGGIEPMLDNTKMI